MAAAKGLKIGKEVLQEMYQSMTCRQIADHFGCGETAIWNRVKQYGIKLAGYEDNPRRRPKPFTAAHLKAIRASHKARRGVFVGPKAARWKGGLTTINLLARASGAYREWKFESLELAGNKCSSCGAKKGSVCECCGQKTALHVHHVHSFAKFPDKRFDPSNSEVLCVKCHHSRHFGKTG